MVSEATFARRIAETGPYEGRPHLAVAVSGGGDSMALTLLAETWRRARQGRLTALIVDHRLRPGSTDEARRVAGWLAARGVDSVVLEWRHGDEPISGGIQERARVARYGLMEDWCRANGVLHLLVGHTLDDQAETYLLRLEKGSGPDGLAAMPRVRETTACRIVRPLLGVTRAALRRWLSEIGQAWIDDPSNANPRFRRTEIRKLFEDGSLDAKVLAASAARYEAARLVLDDAAAELIVRACKFSPAGYAELDLTQLNAAPEDLALRCLGRVVAALGGRPYPPKRGAVEALLGDLTPTAQLRRTLGGCLLAAHEGAATVCREARNLPQPVAVWAGHRGLWDGRFYTNFAPKIVAEGGAWLAALGESGRRWVIGERPQLRAGRPALRQALPTLPALFDDHGVFSVPHLGYRRGTDTFASVRECGFAEIRLAPRNSLVGVGFSVA